MVHCNYSTLSTWFGRWCAAFSLLLFPAFRSHLARSSPVLCQLVGGEIDRWSTGEIDYGRDRERERRGKMVLRNPIENMTLLSTLSLSSGGFVHSKITRVPDAIQLSITYNFHGGGSRLNFYFPIKKETANRTKVYTQWNRGRRKDEEILVHMAALPDRFREVGSF